LIRLIARNSLFSGETERIFFSDIFLKLDLVPLDFKQQKICELVLLFISVFDMKKEEWKTIISCWKGRFK
jgi:hypothetical protein